MAGAALQSAIGFGFALVAAPLLYAAAPSPEEAVGLMIVLGLEVNLLTLLAERRRPAPVWRDVVAVVAWSLPGALAGVAVLRALDAVALQLLVTAGVLVALVVNLRASPSARRPRAGARRVAGRGRSRGSSSGALNTSTSTGGPPVALLLMAPRAARRGGARHAARTSFVGFARRLRRGARADRHRATRSRRGVGRRARPAHRGSASSPAAPLFARIAAARSYERVLDRGAAGRPSWPGSLSVAALNAIG